jgi:hypothetical protein
MNSLVFYHRVVKHETYTCYSSPSKNIHQLAKFTRFVASITPRQHGLSRLVILLAVLQIIFNKRATVKFISVGGAKRICAFSQLSNSRRILDLKDNLFNFTFFKQQRLVHVGFDNDCTLFFNLHTLMFSTFVQYYRYVFNIPRLRISLQVSLPADTLKASVFSRFLRLPLS